MYMNGAGANNKRQLNRLLGALGRGGNGGGNGGTRGGNGGTRANANSGAVEAGVARAAGTGSESGLPTTDDNGLITMNFRQVNQDGAGPLTASIDATSGGTDPSAFQTAQVVQDVPGIGFGGLSGATVADFPLTVSISPFVSNELLS